MLSIKIHPKKLVFYCKVAFAIIMSIAIIMYFVFSEPGSNQLTLSRSLHYSVLFLTYGISWIIGPFLVIRCIYFFIKMVRHGRKHGVNLFSIKFLFNPINLLIFPSLLTTQGCTYRRRCLISFIFFICMLALMLLLSNIGS